jgi:hypothetical protein
MQPEISRPEATVQEDHTREAEREFQATPVTSVSNKPSTMA